MDSEEEFVVHGLNQKQSHSYAEIYGDDDDNDEEEADYCGGEEAEEAGEEIEEQE